MSIVARPRPPRHDDRSDVEAPEALIEEARRRARRRRHGYAAFALTAAAAGLLGFYGLNGGGGDTIPSTDSAHSSPAQVGVPSQVTYGRWRPARGLEGGGIYAIALDPRDPRTLFAATYLAGVFKSSNGGETWRALDITPGLTRFDALAVAPGRPQTIYAGSGRGVFKSTDGGATWQAVNSGLFGEETAAEREHRLEEGFVSALAVDGTEEETVYAAIWAAERSISPGEGLRKSTDGGVSWQRTTFEGSVTALALDPADPGTVYVGGAIYRPGAGFEVGVYKSLDGGASWHPAGLQGMDGLYPHVNCLAVAPESPETIYAATGDGVFRSGDGGTTWEKVGLAGMEIRRLTLDANDPGTVFAESKSRIFMTSDGGTNWRVLKMGWKRDSWLSSLVVDPGNPAIIYAGLGTDDGGVFKSVDGGANWRSVTTGLTAARVSSLGLDPAHPGTAYAGIDGRGVFKRVHGKWQPANTGLTSQGVHAVAIDPRDSANVYAVSDGGIFKSSNDGQSWQRLRGGGSGWRVVSALGLDPRQTSAVYAAYSSDRETRILKSSDGGATWSVKAAIRSWSEPTALLVDPMDSTTLYAGGLGVLKSEDGGLTWRAAGLEARTVEALVADPKTSGIIYAGTKAGLFKSTDAGGHWRLLGDTLKNLGVEAVALDPRSAEMLYAGTDRGVFKSNDGGQNWRRFGGLPLRQFDAIAVDSRARLLYAGAYGGGIFELKLGKNRHGPKTG